MKFSAPVHMCVAEKALLHFHAYKCVCNYIVVKAMAYFSAEVEN